MRSITSTLGLGIITSFTVITLVLVLNLTNNEPPPEFEISAENMVEIKEDVQLDSYGFNTINVELEEGRVKRNESLYLILQDLEVPPQVIYEINKKSDGVFQSNRVKPGQRYIAYKGKKDGSAHRLILHNNALEYVVFDWKNEVKVTSGRKEIETKRAEVSGVIESSLYETLMAQNQNTLLGNSLSEIFAWQIDFFRLYPGDKFKVIYEEQFVDGNPFGIGRVIAAEFTNKNETFDAFYYENEERAGYFDSDGNSVQKALLKAPFRYSQRVSSNFSHSRFHPVLKRRIPHYGVDYAAPIGTPVLSVGDGEVIEARYRGANGNIVKVRHNGTYTTAYLHLNGFAKGIRAGTRVKQGQVIGYVGKTGRVTGVHLDYRIYKNGQPVNPLKVKLPPSKAIGEEEKSNYLRKVEKLKYQLSQIESQQPKKVISTNTAVSASSN
ncbi:MAG: peptidoglycan DD-metalloendopeptidase family protein [Gracilimonas sp.]|uniref:peptidoglycan DD-metalloendopeptidase family protein n=1 Tax=Gracilimonas sp. TaxID=1974203 RepID=UPI0019976EF8|nr:peptidoglycan DD-metalloendopeptidase family protein [Gracilimonas sp.]MBD3615868.1 peptidoglycan DD-metalloendopeptidase family protein [Gracilimonas sp.]